MNNCNVKGSVIKLCLFLFYFLQKNKIYLFKFLCIFIVKFLTSFFLYLIISSSNPLGSTYLISDPCNSLFQSKSLKSHSPKHPFDFSFFPQFLRFVLAVTELWLVSYPCKCPTHPPSSVLRVLLKGHYMTLIVF